MSGFHYTSDPPPDSIFNDIHSLNSFSDELFKEVISTTVIFLAETQKLAWLMTQLDELSQRHTADLIVLKSVLRTLLLILKMQISFQDFRLAIPPLKYMCSVYDEQLHLDKQFADGLRLKLDSQLIKEDFVSLGLSDGKSSVLSDLWKTNQASMLTTAFDQTLTVNRLVDMDWKFGVTAASSAMNKVGNTFLQLKLTIDKGHGKENICMELTLPQFYSFIHEMERAKAAMDYLG